MADNSILNPVPDSQDEPNSALGQESDPNADANVETITESDAESTSEPTVEQIVKDNTEENADPTADPDDSPTPISEGDIDYSAEETDSEDNNDIRRAEEITWCKVIYLTFVTIWIIIVIMSVAIIGLLPCMLSMRGNNGVALYPLNLILRNKWDLCDTYSPFLPQFRAFTANHVAVVQTDTVPCDTPDECAQLLKNMERGFPKMKYNFLISKSGHVYEGLGWNVPSPMFKEKPTLVVAFIGDYEKTKPTTEQLEQLKILLLESQNMNYLSSSYTMVGKKVKDVPTKLFEILYNWDEWNWEDSDTEEVSIDLDPFLISDE